MKTTDNRSRFGLETTKMARQPPVGYNVDLRLARTNPNWIPHSACIACPPPVIWHAWHQSPGGLPRFLIQYRGFGTRQISAFNKNQSRVNIREVWGFNLENEMLLLSRALCTYCIVAFDTEFPGFKYPSPRDASEGLRYEALVSNVNELKLIQLGLTLFDEQGRIGGCWQFNFSDFDVDNDSQVPESIELLRQNGINFEKNRKEGVDSDAFVDIFHSIFSRRPGLRWVTFHGVYDVAYLSKLLMRKEIPCSDYVGFANMVGEALSGALYDVKLMAECYLGQEGCVGLEKLSRKLLVERVGEAHQAGSDSLLTAQLFLKLSRGAYKFVHKMFGGYLYGVSLRIYNRPTVVQIQQQLYMLRST